MFPALCPSLLCHWDGFSYVGLLIHVLTSLPLDVIHSSHPTCTVCVRHLIVPVHLCLRKFSYRSRHFKLYILCDACSSHS